MLQPSLECPICFNEPSKFKVLSCDHQFCESCLLKLAAGELSVAGDDGSAKGASETKTVADIRPTPTILCPKCRKITPLDEGESGSSMTDSVGRLRSKFVGTLFCSNCDASKSIAEFRWCFDCSESLCSSCFVDKHTTGGKFGSDLAVQQLLTHRATKWDENYEAVRFCLSQLKRKIEDIGTSEAKTEEFLDGYLDGLREYLHKQIGQKAASSSLGNERTMRALAGGYGLALETIPRSVEEAAGGKLERELKQALQLAKLTKDSRMKAESLTQMVHDLPYRQVLTFESQTWQKQYERLASL